jgi:hypothetical protein
MLQACRSLDSIVLTGKSMELPRRYPYNPRLLDIFTLFGGGLLWIASDWLPGRHTPTGFSFWFSLIGLLPIAWAVIIGVRWILVQRYLLLDIDSMTLPTGLFRMRTATIEYTSIRRVWRHYLTYTFVLRMATETQIFSILPTSLPDNESYRAVEEFLNRKLLENTRAEKVPENELA